MWYDKPSSKIPLKRPQVFVDQQPNFNLSDENAIWQQNTLPIGNGFIGANIFGEIVREKLTFNEISLWEGGPSKKRPNYNCGNLENVGKHGELFNKVRQLFKDKKTAEAQKLAESLVGDGDVSAFGSYQGFAELYFDFNDVSAENVKNYVRFLDLDKSLSNVEFEYNNIKYTREYFASNPDKVIAIKFNSSAEKMNDIKVSFIPLHNGETVVKDNTITIKGQLDDNQMMFNGKIKVVSTSGIIINNKDHILVSNAKEVVFFVSGVTDYKNEYPKYRTGETMDDIDSKLDKVIQKACEKGYDAIKNDHLIDYQKIFGRVNVNIGQKPSKIPTNELLKEYSLDKSELEKSHRRDLEILLFQYGRYLHISSSREGALPPNLQGIWNDLTKNVPWEGDYHLNINLQMNYFPTFITNMFECGPPLIDYVEALVIPGRITADIYTGISTPKDKTLIKHNRLYPNEGNGYMFHTKQNPFGFTAPGSYFFWGWSPACSLWILTNCFDYYLYTGNVTLLKERIYPLMREVTFYFEKLLLRDEERNRTITSPTYSPEHGPPTNGNTYEQTLLWQHFTNMIYAVKILKVDEEHVSRWKNLLSEFKPIEIGDSGQIKEWYEETYLGSMGDKNHRHMSHLLGLYPLDLINNDESPKWVEAAKISMNDRGDKTTGWGMGQRINAWARTGDGNRALTLIKSLFKNGIYSNLWDTHPPFQIDGNFAATSGIAEMFLTSNVNFIAVLPALPDEWKTNPNPIFKKKRVGKTEFAVGGTFEGLVAKGNIVVGCDWEHETGKIMEIRLNNRASGKEIQLKAKGIVGSKVVDEKGKVIEYSTSGKDKIIFKVEEKTHYSITNFM